MTDLAAASRDSFLALRRVERQHVMIERLYAAGGRRIRLAAFAELLGVSSRTVARDIERLRLSGVPLRVGRGRDGGISLAVHRRRIEVQLDLPEVAAIMSSLTVLGPSASASAGSAMAKLAAALIDDAQPAAMDGTVAAGTVEP